jgi:hypothetical protein
VHNIINRLLGIEAESSLICIDADTSSKCWLALRRATIQLSYQESVLEDQEEL